ncbi:hypothetical protein [Persicobacter diffluens]
MKHQSRYLLLFFMALFLSSCGGKRYYKSPLDVLIRDLDSEPIYTIILYDMDTEGMFSTTYKHQYKVITEVNGEPKEKITPWKEVSQRFFYQYEDAMGMEIASKKEGKVSKSIVPAGYSNYVGNKQYGHWVDRGGTSFWEFYGRFAFMNSMFNMMTYPVRYSYYNDYYSNYRTRGRDYYGPVGSNGRTYYGTYGSQGARSGSSWSKNSSFQSRVSSRTSRSSSTRSTSSSSSSRSSRSSSSSFRSRGGGFGK